MRIGKTLCHTLQCVLLLFNNDCNSTVGGAQFRFSPQLAPLHLVPILGTHKKLSRYICFAVAAVTPSVVITTASRAIWPNNKQIAGLLMQDALRWVRGFVIVFLKQGTPNIVCGQIATEFCIFPLKNGIMSGIDQVMKSERGLKEGIKTQEIILGELCLVLMTSLLQHFPQKKFLKN